MYYNKGPKPNFVMPKQVQSFSEEDKPYSYVDIESTDSFWNEKIKKNVSFVPTITIFLRFQDEDIVKFKERLRKQIQQTKETFDFHPSLIKKKMKGQPKSCLKKMVLWNSQEI